jgi:hypothetical protein
VPPCCLICVETRIVQLMNVLDNANIENATLGNAILEHTNIDNANLVADVRAPLGCFEVEIPYSGSVLSSLLPLVITLSG